MKVGAWLAAAGAAAIAVGVGWIYPPAGLLTAGVELIAAGYTTAYLAARRSR